MCDKQPFINTDISSTFCFGHSVKALQQPVDYIYYKLVNLYSVDFGGHVGFFWKCRKTRKSGGDMQKKSNGWIEPWNCIIHILNILDLGMKKCDKPENSHIISSEWGQRLYSALQKCPSIGRKHIHSTMCRTLWFMSILVQTIPSV